MMHLFLIPGMLVVTLLVGGGLASLEAAASRWAPKSRWLGPVALLLAVALMVIPGTPLRRYADEHPLTHWKFRVEEEGAEKDRSWIPSMRSLTEPERYGRRALERAPHGALVVAGWGEISVLRYLRAVEGLRPDLTIQPSAWTTLADRLRVWQRRHDVAAQPFVFTERPGPLDPAKAVEDSIPILPGRWLYVQRTPIPDDGGPGSR